MTSNRDPQQIIAETLENLDSVEFLMGGMQKIIKISSDKSAAAIRYRYEQLYPENAIKVIEIGNQR